MYVTVDGTRLFFDTEGSGLVADGSCMRQHPIVIVLHGSFLDHSYFKPALSPLAEHCQLMYLDSRGFGRSDLSSPEHWNFAQFTDDVIAVMDTLGIDQAVLLGHSMGCFTAAAIALQIPERITANLLLNPVLINLPVFYQNLLEKIGPQAVNAARVLFDDRDINGINDYLTEVMPYLFQVPPPPEMSTRGKMNPELFLHNLDELLGVDLMDQINQLQMNTLICNGSKDLYNASDISGQLKRQISNTKVTITDYQQSGHFILNDEPEELLRKLASYIQSICPL